MSENKEKKLKCSFMPAGGFVPVHFQFGMKIKEVLGAIMIQLFGFTRLQRSLLKLPLFID